MSEPTIQHPPSMGSAMLAALEPSITAGAVAEAKPLLAPSSEFIKRDAAPVVSDAERQEQLVRETLSRARPFEPAEGPSPIETARADYHQLRIDNGMLADELRLAAIQRDIAEAQRAKLEQDLVAVSERADRHAHGLAVLRAEMLIAGKIIVDLISKVDRELSPVPQAVADYAPKAVKLPQDLQDLSKGSL